MDTDSVIEAPSLECLIFRCCGLLLGCETRRVAKVIPLPAIVPLPRNSGLIAGVFNYRGRILGAIDIRPLIGDNSFAAPLFRWVLLLKGSRFVTGLLVEEVYGIESVADAELFDSPENSPGFLLKTFVNEGRSTALLAVDMLLAEPSAMVSQ